MSSKLRPGTGMRRDASPGSLSASSSAEQRSPSRIVNVAAEQTLALRQGSPSQSRPRTPASAAVTQPDAPEPFLPDEVLEALARDPPPRSQGHANPSPSTAASRTTTTRSLPANRQSDAFDRSYLFDVPSLVGVGYGLDGARRSGDSGSRAPSLNAPGSSRDAIPHGRPYAASHSLGASRESLTSSAIPPRRREPAQTPHASAWSRIAASSAPRPRSTRSRDETHSLSSRSLPRAGDDHLSDLGFHLPTLETGSSPELERALAQLAFEAPLDPDCGDQAPAPRLHVPESDFVVAVIGSKSVGKSTLIRRGLKRASSAPRRLLVRPEGYLASSTISSFTMAGIRQTVEVVEVDSEVFDWNDQQELEWPATIPQAEGVLLCYDASDPDALSDLSRFLRAFSTRGADVPLIVLACKSSATGSDAVDPQAAAHLCDSYGAGIVRLDGGTEDPQRKSKECFSWVIKQIMDNRGETHFFNALVTPTEDLPKLQLPQIAPPQAAEDVLASPPRTLSLSSKFTLVETSPVTIDSPTKDKFDASFAAAGVAKPATPTSDRTNLAFRPEDLVDKFLLASIAGDDEDFVTAFLITFRRFVLPSRVLEQLIDRFRFIEERDSETTLKRYGQLRLCSTLSMWVQSYPGDFANPTMLDLLRLFVEVDLPQGGAWLSHHVYELTPLLPSLAHLTDPDIGWSVSTVIKTTQRISTQQPRPRSRVILPPSRSQISLASTTGSSEPPSLTGDTIASSTGLSQDQQSDKFSLESKAASLRSASSPATREMPSVTAIIVDTSNALVEVREQDIALQITRLAWKSLAGITPRDAMRHVLDRKNESDTVKQSPIARSIAFVNHLARWVATMILVQSRPRVRALLAEKFIFVASELRARENFDSLMGVLAGLNMQAVHRLTDTFDAVTDRLDGGVVRAAAPGESRQPKKLRSLNLLMAPARSFAAYRLALSTSSRDALPYLGVVLQDLTVINETASDFEEGLVNWSKFANLGRSCSILLDCPKTPPRIAVDADIEQHILDVPLLTEDRLYALSYAYQPREGKSAGRSRLRELARNALY